MTTQPEALRLADHFNCVTDDGCGECIPCRTAIELRRLHAENEALKQRLAMNKDICIAQQDLIGALNARSKT